MMGWGGVKSQCRKTPLRSAASSCLKKANLTRPAVPKDATRRGSFKTWKCSLALLSRNVPRGARCTIDKLPHTIDEVSKNASRKSKNDIPRYENYSEASRRYRRTVYTDEKDWIRHRSSSRLFDNLWTTLSSGVVRSLWLEVGSVFVIGLAVVLWNAAVLDYTDFSLVTHPGPWSILSPFALKLSSIPFTISSPALGLLLVFRTNASYSRWLEGQRAWGRISSYVTNTVRQSLAWGSGDPEQVHRIAGLAGSFARCLKCQLQSTPEEELQMELERLLIAEEVELIMSTHKKKRSTCVLGLLSAAIYRQLDLDDPKCAIEMDKSVIKLNEELEICERIYSSPVPLVYTRHTGRFLILWLLFVPLALYEPMASSWNHVPLIPASTLIAIFLFGVEELSIQLEEPFSIMPLDATCDRIDGNNAEMISFQAQSKALNERLHFQKIISE